MGHGAHVKISETQETNKILGTLNKAAIVTTETLELLLKKLPEAARNAFRVPDTTHNLIAVCELVDAGCGVHIYKHSAEIEFEGETLYQGWRDKPSRLWRFSLTSKGEKRSIPPTDPEEYDPSSGMVLSVYECEIKQQMIKYYHASLGSHLKRTLIEAANAGYLKGWPGLIAAAIIRYVSVEDATEMGHMKHKQQGTQSTTNKSRQGRSSKHTQQSDTAAAIADAISLPAQEQDNNKTHMVFMSVKRV